MSEVPTTVDAVEEDAALDAELNASIADIKAGQTEAPVTEDIKGEEPSKEADATGEAPTSEPQATGEQDYRLPNQGKWESDVAFEKRVELFDLVKRRQAATTPEAKQALTVEIKNTKGDLKNLGSAERFTQPRISGTSPEQGDGAAEADPNFVADQERFKQLGGFTREEMKAELEQDRHETAVRSDLESFVGKHNELKDEDVREVFFDFVEDNYAWQDKSGKALAATLEMAYENMFRPSESVQDRVLKSAGVQEKVNAMQFPGGTGNQSTYSPAMMRDIKELTDTGMTEEKALELLSEE